MTSHRRTRTAFLAVLLIPALVLSGCGGGESTEEKPKAEPSADLPQGNVEVPDAITLTRAGTSLKFGEPAYVAYEPNAQRSSVISLSVNSIQAAKISDFASYQLDDRTKKSRPYYVRVTVKNVGTGDVGRAAVPLLAVNNTNSLVQPSTFTNNTLARCPSTPLPAAFAAGRTYQGCLVYLMPEGGTLVEMSYRPLQSFPPILWKGAIVPVKAEPRKGDKLRNKKKAKP